jgi:hypothetical protein
MFGHACSKAPTLPPRLAREHDGDPARTMVMVDARGHAYECLDEALNKLSGNNYTATSADRTLAVSELLWTLRVLLEDGGDDDAENTIRMAALMARS